MMKADFSLFIKIIGLTLELWTFIKSRHFYTMFINKYLHNASENKLVLSITIIWLALIIGKKSLVFLERYTCFYM